ncbi:MAG: hypothetical protein DMG26_00370 [Acidobacteria bacterium]|nr:MAG: hypothetical protein DMG26_00370 [Acidobacteriota bacterium]
MGPFARTRSGAHTRENAVTRIAFIRYPHYYGGIIRRGFACHISRVENGHTVPTLETLERLASVLDIPLYQLFYE